mgnify:CR=1 FL=1
MEAIRNIKRELILAQVILGLSLPPEYVENRKLVIEKAKSLINVLKGQGTNNHLINNEEVINRRKEELNRNNSLQDIFSLVWNMLEEHIEDGYMNKEGYKKLAHKMNIVLFGFGCNMKENSSFYREVIEMNWNIDIQRFGLINKVVFFDILYEYFDTWSGLLHINLYGVFIWVVLDCIVDTARNPQKLRHNKELCCILDIPYGDVILGKL